MIVGIPPNYNRRSRRFRNMGVLFVPPGYPKEAIKAMKWHRRVVVTRNRLLWS